VTRAKEPLFEKSGAKTFLNHGQWRLQPKAPGPDKKSFLMLFYKKAVLTSLKP
jgi:hypothetical protein